MSLDVLGDESSTYIIQASSDLVNWVTIGSTSTDGNGQGKFTDSKASSEGVRFYRVLEPDAP